MTETYQQMLKRHRQERRIQIVRNMRRENGNTSMAADKMGVEVRALRGWIKVEFGGVPKLREGLKL